MEENQNGSPNVEGNPPEVEEEPTPEGGQVEAPPEDPAEVAQIQEATQKLMAFLTEKGIQAYGIMADWKESSSLLLEVAEFLREHPGWMPYAFPAWHSFEHGSGDDQVTVLTSGYVTPKEAEWIADLAYNCGAEIPGL